MSIAKAVSSRMSKGSNPVNFVKVCVKTDAFFMKMPFKRVEFYYAVSSKARFSSKIFIKLAFIPKIDAEWQTQNSEPETEPEHKK